MEFLRGRDNMYDKAKRITVIKKFANGNVQVLIQEPVYDFVSKRFLGYDKGKQVKRTRAWLNKNRG